MKKNKYVKILTTVNYSEKWLEIIKKKCKNAENVAKIKKIGYIQTISSEICKTQLIIISNETF